MSIGFLDMGGNGRADAAEEEISRLRKQLLIALKKNKGARDCLKEAAKQFRLTGNQGHAKLCEIHASNLES